MTAAPPRPLPLPAARPADPAVQHHRRLRLAGALTAAQLRLAVVPGHAVRRRQRVQVCSAARILTALGVRVRVHQPTVPWPRQPGRLVPIGDEPGWLGDLALVTAVPRTTLGWSAVADSFLRPRTGSPAVEDPGAAVLCPVTVRFTAADGDPDGAPRTLSEVLAARDLVVEVHLLPAVELP